MSESVKRIFLGWDESLVNRVRDYLLEGVDVGKGLAPDLEGTLVVVPTRQAGRRLRESLALWCHERGTALLSAQIVPPNYLFASGLVDGEVASDALTLSTWVQVLLGSDIERLKALFPSLDDDRSFQWALNTGEILQQLRAELSDGAFLIKDVVEQFASELEELDRWQNMAELEGLYLAEINKLGKQDMCMAKIEAATSVQLDVDIRKIIVAGVPDPSLLALKVLEQAAAGGIDVEILIHAEAGSEDAFDKWGRPEADFWRNVNIDLPDWEDTVFLEAKPSDQANRVLREIAESQDKYEPGEIAIGVPDRAVVPFLEKVMGRAKLPPFDPSDKLVSNHPIGTLSACILDLIQSESYASVTAILRHPDYMSYLQNEHALSSLKYLQQLDEFQNYYLPVNLNSMLARFKGNPKGAMTYREDFSELGLVLAEVRSTLDIFNGAGFEEAWRIFYKKIYKSRILKPGVLRDDEFENAAQAVDAVIRNVSELQETGVDYDMARYSAFFVSSLSGKLYHRERRNELIDLEGWLELPWNDRPFLIVTGMNEQFVPGGSLSDVFLPDSLRRVLDLRDDAARFARDIFLMSGMIRSRAKAGRTCFIVGKTAISGDPLKPSRLFFRCDDSELPARVEKLLAETASDNSRSYPQVIFKLDASGVEKLKDISAEKYISVTALKDYLACPYRFYLKRVLGMEEKSFKAGLDDMDFGSIVHAVLQDMGMDKDLWAHKDPEALGNILADLAEQKVGARFGSPPSPYISISLIAAQERLRAAACAQVALVEQGWEIVDVETGQGKKGEERDRWKLTRNGFTVSGIIDRIDQHADGRIRIIDYKTFDDANKTPESEHLTKRGKSTPAYNWAEQIDVVVRGRTKKEDRRWKDLQLAVYAMIYNQDMKYRKDLELAYFILPKVVSNTGVSQWLEFDPDRMESAVNCLDGVLEGIANQIFWPPSEKVEYDDFEDMFRFEESVKELKR